MHYVAFLLVAALLRIIQTLPPSFCGRLGRLLGKLAAFLLPAYRRLVEQNLLTAFGSTLPPSEIRRMAREAFPRLGSNLIGAARFLNAPETLTRAHTTIENLDILHRAHARGHGVILAISHIGNWELFAQACFYAPNLPFGTVFQKLHNPHLDALLTAARQRLGVKTFDRKSGLHAAAAFLRSGGVLGILIDQHAGDSGIWTPLFNRLASTSPLAASLALTTSAAIVPVAIYQTSPSTWRIHLDPEVPVHPNDTPETLTARLNRTLEHQIRRSPLDWFWVHNRWKLPRPKFLLSRTKRGIHLPPEIPPSALRPLRLVLRSPNWLGDAVMCLPAARRLKASRPDLHLSVLCPQKLADLWHTVPEIDTVLPIPPRRRLLSAVQLLRQGNFDAALLFPNSFRSALEAWLARIPRRVGLAGHNRRPLLNQVIPPPKKSDKAPRPRHHTQIYLHIIRTIGADPATPLPPLIRHPEPNPATPTLAPILAGVCPGAEYGPAKRWPIEHFRTVMEAVSAQHPSLEWHIFGLDKDRPLAAALAHHFPGRIEDRTGRTTLAELISELGRLRVLLTNDTGTMHLAAALGVPVVAIFGSTSPELTGPHAMPGARATILHARVECSPCFLRHCPLDLRCMHEIPQARAIHAVLRHLPNPAA